MDKDSEQLDFLMPLYRKLGLPTCLADFNSMVEGRFRRGARRHRGQPGAPPCALSSHQRSYLAGDPWSGRRFESMRRPRISRSRSSGGIAMQLSEYIQIACAIVGLAGITPRPCQVHASPAGEPRRNGVFRRGAQDLLRVLGGHRCRARPRLHSLLIVSAAAY